MSVVAESLDHNRLLMELNRAVRNANREIINPLIPELTIDELTPVMAMVARARGDYLKALFTITESAGEGLPSNEDTQRLRKKRERYEELLAAAKSLEVAIERGYLDVSG